ncbi:hypothetical protein CEUSTIGMA_g4376.t1 [Chlamydomonas eustigma]|uniref:DUF7906 domain-containing protein n=1 Tax=Chlamydomonas eustigma TaxID=1157962 RepID=A0A250X1W5_9CHLO|nr:hypothetical protein CEUSTIGMA_g4376.t1 [Chlamydomonas eustigma]|eukprot:GAX76929.1 hypothetical protein CEUSTIGMA_g4376.t1 [Chlamydomonas eustigma]
MVSLLNTSICFAIFLAICMHASSEGERKRLFVKSRARTLLSQIVLNATNERDPYTHLRQSMRQSWRLEPYRNISQLKDSFLSVPSRIIVAVKLVGFTGPDSLQSGIPLSSDLLNSHLENLQRDLHAVVLQPEIQHLAVQPSIHFEVSHLNVGVAQQINHELNRALANEKARPGWNQFEEVRLNYRTVDRVIEEQELMSQSARVAAKLEGTASWTVYIVHPKSLSAGDKPQPYAYSYEEPGSEKLSVNQSCPGSSYVSSSLPYVWVDIRAGPCVYGPKGGHRGQVMTHSFPHPMFYKDDVVTKAIIPDLAALVWSACQHMVWPPMLHEEVDTRESLLIQVIHMYDSLAPPPDRLDQLALQATLRSALTTEVLKSIQVSEVWISFAHCDACVNSYTMALKLHTAQDDGKVFHQARTVKVLDRLVAHTALREHKDDIMAYAGLHFAEDRSKRVFPVFVFDISEGGPYGILFDGAVKATAFSDMAIAVSSRADAVTSHFLCRYSKVEPPAGDITREVLAAILSAVWAVPDPALYYSAGSGQTEDYRWSVGNTPFGPLSHKISLTTPLIQAAKRNTVISLMEKLIRRITRLLDAFEIMSYNGRLDQDSLRDQRDEVIIRLTMAQYKLEEAGKMLGQWNVADAARMVRSMTFDVNAIESKARKLSRKVNGQMQCEGKTSVLSIWWAPVGAVLAWPLAIWVRARLSSAYSSKQGKIY